MSCLNKYCHLLLLLLSLIPPGQPANVVILITVTAANDMLTAPTSTPPAGPPLRRCRRTTAVTLALFWISPRLRWRRLKPRCLHFRLAIASGTCCWGTRHFRTMTGNVKKTCTLWYSSSWGLFYFTTWLQLTLAPMLWYNLDHLLFVMLLDWINKCKGKRLSKGFAWWQSISSQGYTGFWTVWHYFPLVCLF